MSKNINSSNKNQRREVTIEAEHGIGTNPGIRGTGINTVTSRLEKSKVEDLKVAGKVKDRTQIMENRKNIDIYIKSKLTVEITKCTVIRLNLKQVNRQITLIVGNTLEHLNIS